MYTTLYMNTKKRKITPIENKHHGTPDIDEGAMDILKKKKPELTRAQGD